MDIDLRSLIAKLNAECRRALEQAAELCVRQTHYNVEIEHLLLRLIEQPAPDLDLVLRHFDIKPDSLAAQLTSAMDRFKRGNGRTPALSPHFTALIQEAWLISSMHLGEQFVRSGSLLLGLLQVDSLRSMLLESAPALLQIPRESLRNALAGIVADSTEGVGTPGPAGTAGPARPRAAVAATPVSGAAKGAATPALDQYTVDLTAQARDGKVDPIRGRDPEIRQIIDILLRRRQNNPILTGEAGVGKTAVVEGFALSVANGKVPPALRHVSIRTLDLGLLQAGAGIKGEFENRLKSVIAEVKASAQPIILFIDEAHQLIGAGGPEGQGDAANLLKPALARGELRTIAATTWTEYKKYVEKDPALARRFQVIKVDEPSEEAAIDMLRGVVENLERHHQVRILDVAVRDAVRLSHRYVTGRQLPDKAISVLDTACARVAIGQTGTPPEVEDATRTLENLETELRILRQESLTGADHARRIQEITEGIQKQRIIQKQLLSRLEEERQAVADILVLRRSLDETIDGAPARNPDGDFSEVAELTNRLGRLERGLEAIQNDEPMVPVCVDPKVVASVISGWTGIPVGKMMVDELRTVLNLKERLAERVVGQDQALEAIARRVRTFRADLDDPGNPVGVFLLVGPSGVGKTETAAALADQLYGGERNMIVVNMSEWQEAHTVSSLKGAPPGYVGYGRGGVLTEAVRRKPYSVVLLDEVEKAHPDVMELFYNVFDKGIMEDGEGVLVDFKNTVILLTSNAGQEIIIGACEGRSSRPDPDILVEKLRPALLRHFAPAFLGRLVTVPYYPLGDAEIRVIVELKLAKIQERFRRNHQADLGYDRSLIEAITDRCTEVDSGARNINHILTNSLLPELSTRILELMSVAETFTSVHVSLDASGGFAYKFSNQPAVPDTGPLAGDAAGNVQRIGTG